MMALGHLNWLFLPIAIVRRHKIYDRYHEKLVGEEKSVFGVKEYSHTS